MGDETIEDGATGCKKKEYEANRSVPISLATNRPKSALRRRTVDRDEEDDEDDEDSDEEFEPNNYEKFFQEGEFDTEKALEDEIVILQSHRDTTEEQINNQGVQELFSDILFPQPELEQDNNGYPINIQELLEESSRILEPENSLAEVEEKVGSKSTFRRLLNSAPDGAESFAKDERQWMDKVLKRQKLDPEGQAQILLLQEETNQQMRPRQLFSLGYPELQKATGLRVLRRVVERQHSLERDEEKLLRQLRQSAPLSAGSLQGESHFSRKPPARLKPLHVDNDDDP